MKHCADSRFPTSSGRLNLGLSACTAPIARQPMGQRTIWLVAILSFSCRANVAREKPSTDSFPNNTHVRHRSHDFRHNLEGANSGRSPCASGVHVALA